MKNILKSVLLLAALTVSAFAQTYQPVASIQLKNQAFSPSTSTITSTLAFPSPWGAIGQSLQEFDPVAYTQARVIVTLGSYAPNSTTSLVVRYQPVTGASFTDNTFADYLQLGASGDVSVALNSATQTVYIGAWTPLAAGALGDDVFTVGVVDTAGAGKFAYVESILLQFR